MSLNLARLPQQLIGRPPTFNQLAKPQTGNPVSGVTAGRYYSVGTQNQTLNPATSMSLTGTSLPHNNMMSYLVVNFCIALQGVFPPRG